MTHLFVTGMFRSGTTLLAKMLDAHGEICCANDPYLPLFKEFRNEIEAQDKTPGYLNRPLDDYYFDAYYNDLMTRIQNASFEQKLNADTLAKIQKDTTAYTKNFSPEIADNTNQIKGATYAEALDSSFTLVDKMYGQDKAKIISFKAAWTNEFIPHVLNSDKTSKVICIVRDPRAVCASKNAMPEKYPWMFLIRQWRKQALFAWRAQQNPAWKNRVLVVKYEDLISKPADHAKKISAFLGVTYDPAMADAMGFKDHTGSSWRGNSSHFEEVNTFNTEAIKKWQQTLTAAEIEYIEYLCRPEMLAFGYEPVNKLKSDIPEALLSNPPAVPVADLAKWIQPYEVSRLENIIQDTNLERTRHAALFSANIPGERTLTLLFLDPAFYHASRSLVADAA